MVAATLVVNAVAAPALVVTVVAAPTLVVTVVTVPTSTAASTPIVGRRIVITTPAPSAVRPDGRQLEHYVKIALGVVQSGLHGLVAGRRAEGDLDRRLAIGVRLGRRRGDGRAIGWVHELE
jgi:hypothetical protein